MNKILIAKDAAEKAMLAEIGRMESLLSRSGKVAAGILVVLGFQLLDTKTLLESSSVWVKFLCYLSLAALGLSLLFAFLASISKGFAGYPRGNRLWETLKPDHVTEETAEEAIVQLLLKNREQNALLNDAKERSLCWGGWIFLAAVLLVVASQLLDAYLDTLT